MANNHKVIVTCAVTGAIHTPAMSPYLPCGEEGISQAAIDAANAGASMVHIHCREDSGRPTANLEVWGETLSRVKAGTDAIIGITTGGAIGMSVEERLAAVPLYRPEVASFNGGSMNFNLAELARGVKAPKYDWELPFLENTAGNVFRNTFVEMEKCLAIMEEAGTVPEFEIFDFGQLNNIRHLYKKGLVREPLYFQFVPGILGGIPMTAENILYFQTHLREFFGDKANFSMVAGGRRNFRYETLGVILGGNVRVGMEDSLYHRPDGELAVSNAQQVEKMIRILRELDYEIATPEEARAVLHTKGKDKVNF